MINFKSPITIAIILILVIIAGAMIGSSQWISNIFTSAPKIKEGDACIDSNGNPSTIANGVCKEVVINPPAGETVRIVTPSVPTTLRIRKYGRSCQGAISVPQYPGVRYILIGSDRLFCYYRKA